MAKAVLPAGYSDPKSDEPLEIELKQPLVAAVLEQGLRPGNLAGVLRPEVLEAGVNTVVSSVLSAVLATAAGAALAVLLDRTDLPGRNWLRAVLLLPFLIPPFIGAMAWMALLAPGGLVNSLRESLLGAGPDWTVFGMHGVVLVLAVHSCPLAYLVIAVALRRVPPDLEDAARVSGATTARVLRDVTLPLMRPGVAAAKSTSAAKPTSGWLGSVEIFQNAAVPGLGSP